MDRRKIKKRLAFLIVIILIVNFLANKFYWYSSIWWFDMPMHFLGGFWIGLAFFYIFPPQSNSVNTILKALLLVLLIGVGWELFEILVNDLIAKSVFNTLDTISDIFFDLSGGAFAILYYLKRIMPTSEKRVQ